MNHWNPVLYENRNLVPRSPKPDYHLTVDLADRAIDWTRKVTSISPDKPFFLYVAPGANHSPHHAPREWIDKFRGAFDQGWDAYREATLARQKRLGVVPPDTKLTARSEGLPAWDSLEPGQKRIYSRMMEVFAGYAAYVDHEMGRIVEAIQAMPNADNTIFIYIAGDNGASAEGGLEESINENLFYNGFPERWQDNLEHIDELGGPKWFNHFPSSWAHAMNSPFQWTKQVASHLGGTRNPMIISWPKRIKEKGGLRSQFLHVIDLVPTLYDAIGITPPDTLNGIAQRPLEGASFKATFDRADAPESRETQYFELLVNRGVYDRGWLASSRSFVPWSPIRGEFDPLTAKWELYHIPEDCSQSTDLASTHPEKVRELEELFWKEAEKYKVLPLDWRAVERLNGTLQGRPSLAGERKRYVYYPGQVALPDGACPPLLNRSFTITAEFQAPEAGVEDVLVALGGITGGYVLYVRDGRIHFVYNLLAIERTEIVSEPIGGGKHRVALEVDYEGRPGEFGKAASVRLTVDGAKTSTGRLARTIPLSISLGEGIDVGMDFGSAVDQAYSLPYAFTGSISNITYDLR